MITYCVVTGSRAEYGLLMPLMKGIKKDRGMHLQLLVTGMHLSPEFGMTIREIEKDSFTIDEKVEMLLSGDTSISMIKSMGVGLIGYADAFSRLKPDWVIVLGDRFESFMATTAAYVSRIPVIHISGGETTAGAMDEAFRHSITKMSYLHLTSLEEYRNRVIQLGEVPNRVFNVGALGLDNIFSLKLLSRKDLEKKLGIRKLRSYALITFHPVTLETTSAITGFKNLLAALDKFKEFDMVFTMPNADEGGREITNMIKQFTSDNPHRSMVFSSVGQLNYLSLMKHATLMVGNSSSGIVESPSFGIPVVNIGDRQKGRVKAGNIIDCGESEQSILKAIKKALSGDFQATSKKVRNPYGKGNSVKQIMKIIAKYKKLPDIKKRFFDLK